MSLQRYSLFFWLAMLLMLPVFTVAQSTNGNIVGTVTDANGAALPNTSITITNTQTNAFRTIVSDSEGSYNAPNLPIGNYQIVAELPGFKRSVLSSVQLAVNQTARLDITMEAGNVAEQVVIESGSPLVESETSVVGQVIQNQTIVQLPLNGRNFIRLGSLIPGTNEGAPGQSVTRSRQGGVALVSNGQRAEYNNFTLDGVDNNETLFGVAVVVPSIDAIQEFKVQTSNYSAEFGRGSGANVNVAIKSGTNAVSGSLFEFVRNDALDARNPFANSKPSLRRNQFGFAVGGPMPFFDYRRGADGLFRSGKDNTFFFVNYEALIERRGNALNTNVPTVAQRNGVFTGLIRDPQSGLPCTAANQSGCFANNTIPNARISESARRLFALMPLPNSTGAFNYVTNLVNPLDNSQVNLRFDHRATDNDQFFVRYSQTSSEANAAAINLNSQQTNIKTRGLALSYTRVVSNSAVNEFKFGYQKYGFDLFSDGSGTNGAAELGLPSFTNDETFYRYPTILITGVPGFGGGISNPLFRGEDSYQFLDNFNLSTGKHSLKFGGDARYYKASNLQPQFAMGEYTFNGTATGNAIADVLLGIPSQQRILNTTGFDYSLLNNWRVSLYLQDDFQISSRLTLNLGLRWERDGAWKEENNRFGFFDFRTGQVVYPSALPQELRTVLDAYGAATANNPNAFKFRYEDLDSMRSARNKQFAPRVGFAFRPFNDSSTVIRGAYGVFWGQPIANVYLNVAFTPPPFSLGQTVTGANQQWGVFPGVTPSTLVPVNPSFFTITPDEFNNSYVQQWNLGIERELGWDTAVKISYVGSRGANLEKRYDFNSGQPSTTAITPARRPYPQYNSIQMQESSGKSSYNSLQVGAQKRYSDGFLFLAGYTWAKSLDDSSTWLGLGGHDSQFPQNPRNMALEWARSGFDLKHRFTLSAVYDLPFKSDNRALDMLIGGFQLSGIATFRTGYPFSVTVSSTDSANITGTGTANTRANIIGDPWSNIPEGYFFNPAAFAAPASGTFGNTGRNIMTGPGAQQLDFSLLKVIRFSEKYSLQLRAEAFNALNHPTYGLPVANTNAAAGTFGRLNSADNREMQLGIKFLF